MVGIHPTGMLIYSFLFLMTLFVWIRNMSDEMPTKSDMEFDERSILLFDLEFDPSEKNNLFASNINNSDVREVADKLFGLLISHRQGSHYLPFPQIVK